MKIKIRNSNTKRRRLGFRARMKTRNGRKIVNRRRALRGTCPEVQRLTVFRVFGSTPDGVENGGGTTARHGVRALGAFRPNCVTK